MASASSNLNRLGLALLICLVLLLAACGPTNPFVDAQGVKDEMSRLEMAVQEEDRAAAAATVETIRNQWEAAEPWLAVHNDQRDIRRFTTGLGRTEIFVDHGDLQPILLELVVMRQAWETLVTL